MNRSDALEILENLRPRLEARGVAHAGLFGSIARNAAGKKSDIDVVVTPAPGRRLDLIDLGGIQTVIEEGFAGLDVDVVVEPITRSDLKRAVERDRVNAF